MHTRVCPRWTVRQLVVREHGCVPSGYNVGNSRGSEHIKGPSTAPCALKGQLAMSNAGSLAGQTQLVRPRQVSRDLLTHRGADPTKEVRFSGSTVHPCPTPPLVRCSWKSIRFEREMLLFTNLCAVAFSVGERYLEDQRNSDR